MSPRAACRLATLGFTRVYDYRPGKVDWLARGLPHEGTKAGALRAIDFARQDVAVATLGEQVGAIASRARNTPYGFAYVVSDSGVLLGRLRRRALDSDANALVDDVMEPGPSTVRADTPADKLLERLTRQDLTTAILTDPDGRLLGTVHRSELADAIAAPD
jgi:Mg/Co/Ni transporter MgtE